MKIARNFLFYILSILLIFATLTVLFFVYGVFPMFQQLQFNELYSISLRHGSGLMDSAGQEKHLMTIIVYVITAVSFAYILLILIYISRNVVKPIEKAVEFSDSLARGEFPEKLRCGKSGSDEIFALVKSLNFLRDRLHNSINKLKSSHQREKKARENAENADALKSDFLSRLSPELRSPLNAILGFAEIIENDIAKGCYDPLLQQRVKAIWRNAETLNRQLASLLDLGTMPTSAECLTVTEFSTADFMRQLVEYNAFCLHEKNISFVNHFSPDAPEFLSTDREVLLFVLSTLIKALARASGKGETISCGCSREDDKIVFWVRDNRKSDSNESLAALFKRYQLGKNKDFSAAAPAVINLMLVVSKSELIGGEVSAESTDAHNSEFRLSFKTWRIVAEHTKKHSGPHSASNNQDLNKTPFDIDADESFHIDQEKQHYRVLLAEDDSDNALIVRTMLEDDGCEIVHVTNGEDMMLQLGMAKFNILIMSLYLPLINGHEAIEEILDCPATKNLPIIVITGYLSHNDRQQLLVSGATRCFVKPFNFSLLRKTVQKFCRKNVMQESGISHEA